MQRAPARARRKADGAMLFPTPIGACGVAWSAHGLVALQLPEPTEERTLARLRASVILARSEAQVPPARVKAAIARIVRLLEGSREDLSSIDLDLESAPPFHRKVYEA